VWVEEISPVPSLLFQIFFANFLQVDLINENRSKNLKSKGRFLLEKTPLQNRKIFDSKNPKTSNYEF
jgi:hypothetical protein